MTTQISDIEYELAAHIEVKVTQQVIRVKGWS